MKRRLMCLVHWCHMRDTDHCYGWLFTYRQGLDPLDCDPQWATLVMEAGE